MTHRNTARLHLPIARLAPVGSLAGAALAILVLVRLITAGGAG